MTKIKFSFLAFLVWFSVGLGQSASHSQLGSRVVSSATSTSRSELFIVDAKARDLAEMIEKNFDRDVVVIPENQDGLEFILETLKDRRSTDVLHIISHGDIGKLHLGNLSVDQKSLQGQNSEKLSVIKTYLSEDADILLYGCNIAKDSTGQEFINQIADLTGADVAASQDDTGSAALGGDWLLERTSGSVEASTLAFPQWPQLLIQRHSTTGLNYSLDWLSAAWTTGSYNQTFSNIQSSGANLQISYSDTSRLTSIQEQNTASLTGGEQTVFTMTSGFGTTSTTVTMNFTGNTPTAVGFDLFHINLSASGTGTAGDNFTITATTNTGTVINPTFTTAGATSSTYTVATNVVNGYTTSTTTASNMQLGVNFTAPAGQSITSITLVWRDATGVSGVNPHGYGFGKIDFVVADYGDAPDASGGTTMGNYRTTLADGGPSHTVVSGLGLGSVAADNDSETLQNATATADDTNGTDDEDGVASFPTLTTTSGVNYTVSVNVTNASGTSYLAGYIDFNKDGDFSVSERSNTVIVNTSGSQSLSWTTPSGMTAGTTYARFRISRTRAEAESSIGASSSGEVEDYQINIFPGPVTGRTPTVCPAGSGVYADWGTVGSATSGTGIFSAVAPNAAITPNFTWTVTGDVNSNNINGSETFSDGTQFEAIFGQADSAKNINFRVNVGDAVGAPITRKLFVTINFDSATLANSFGFSFDDIESDQLRIRAKDASGADVSVAEIASWFVETFDANTVTDGLNYPVWDPNEAALVGYNTTGPAAWQTVVRPNTIGNEAPGGWFQPDIALSQLTIEYQPADQGSAPSAHMHMASCLASVDYGDAPDSGAGTATTNYKTLSSDGGPSHIIISGLRLHTNLDSETGTLQNATATADDTTGTPDDEDSISSFPALATTSGATYTVSTSVTNSTGSDAYLVGYIDFNKDGDFLDTGEKSSTVIVGTSATNPRSFDVSFTTPAGMTPGTTYARFRLSNTRAEAESSIGLSSSGEVEDYQLTILPTVTLQKTTNGGTNTAGFTLSNVDTNLVTAGLQTTASITTTAAGTATAYDANTSVAGTQPIVVQSLGSDVTITEDAPPSGWALGSVSCTNGTTTITGSVATRSVTIPAASLAGANFTCTFTNNKLATLNLVKLSTTQATPFDFTVSGMPSTATGSPNAVSVTSFPVNPSVSVTGGYTATQTYTNVTPGVAITIRELASSNTAQYSLISIICSDASGAPTGSSSTITYNPAAATGSPLGTLIETLVPGANVTCTFTNVRNPEIVITKNAIGGDGTFAFTGSSSLSGTSFLASGVSITTASGTGFNSTAVTGLRNNDVTNVTITETAPTGFYLSAISCTDLATNTTLTASTTPSITLNLASRQVVLTGVTNNQRINCTFTNQKIPTVTIKKSSVGGTGSFSFSGGTNGLPPSNTPSTTLSLNTATANPQTSTTYSLSAVNTATSITETIPSGWILSSVSCVDASGTSVSGLTTNLTTGLLTIPASAIIGGAALTCTFVNTLSGSVTGTLYADYNNSGAFESGTDIRLGANISVELVDSGGTVIQTVTTTSSGVYTFSNVLPGSYTVRLVTSDPDLGTAVAIAPSSGSATVSVTSGATTTQNFGFNSPPVANNVTTSSISSSAGPTTISGLSATDSDGTIASYTVSTIPPSSQGTLYLSDGVTVVTAGMVLTPAQASGLQFDPSGTYSGSVTFTFTATDNNGAVDATPATYTIPVTNVPPVANDVTNSTSIANTAGPTTIDALSATDSDGTIASYTVSTLPPAAQGTLYLSDGTTAVTAGMVLTPAQAASLRFDPSGTYSGSVTFTFTATDNNGAVDATPATFTIPVNSPDLTIAKTHSPSYFPPGFTGTYTLTISNSGMAATGGTITVTDTLPTGLSVNGGAAGTITEGGTNAADWICNSDAATPQVITCTSSTAIAISGSSVFSFPVNVASSASAAVTNNVSISGGSETTTYNGNNTASDLTNFLQPVGCTTKLYLSQNPASVATTLYDVITTSNPFTFSAIGDNSHGLSYNALAVNPLNGFLFAIESNTTNLVMIGPDGSVVSLGTISSLPTGVNYVAGDIDPAGNYYVRQGGLANNLMYRINLTTRAATTITLSSSYRQIGDFAYSVPDGLLYGVTNANSSGVGSRFVSISPTGTVTVIGTAEHGDLANGFGGMWASSSGTIYGSSNAGAGFFEFNKTTGQRTKISDAPGSTNNDGAHCVNSPITFGADLYVTKTDGATTFVPGTTVTYTVVAGNNGPFGASNVRVQDAVPAGIPAANVSYTAVASAGSNTTVSGTQTGAIDDYVGLPVGGTVTYTVNVQVPAGFTGNLVNTASVTASTDTSDTDTTNNSVTDTNTQVDYGDAPDTGASTAAGNYRTLASDGGASHTVISGLRLGGAIDGDSGALQNATATADDTNNTDDEDAVASFPTLTTTSGATYTVSVSVTNSTGSDAYLVGYIDFNNDGDFLDTGEKSTTVAVATSATNPRSFSVSFTTPAGMTTGNTFARFRLSNTQTQAESPVGASTSGEVEDYQLSITAPNIDLSISKSSDLSGPQVGDTVTYTITAENLSTTTATGVVVTDTFPADLTFIETVGCAEDPNVLSTSTITCSLGTINGSSNTSFTVQGIVIDQGVPGDDDDSGRVINNSVSVVANEPENNTSNNSSNINITVSKLKLSKEVRNVTTGGSFTTSVSGKPGELLEYRITYLRTGSAAFDVLLKDSVPANTALEQNVYVGAKEITLRCPDGTDVLLETGAVSLITIDLAAQCVLSTAIDSSATMREALLGGETGYFLFRTRIQ